MTNIQNQILSIELSSTLESLIKSVKESLINSKNVTVSKAWGILQLAVADTIRTIEISTPSLKGTTKKEIALSMISSFYDKVFLVVTVPYVPAPLQPIISKYTKALLMLLVSSAIDSMVQIFKQSGIFESTRNSVDPALDSVQKVSDK
jgi:hypothetical protein